MRQIKELSKFNDRQDKKLSKKLKEAAPKLFKDAWKCEESNVWCVGGDIDYWGEGQDAHTCLGWFLGNWFWVGDFPTYPEGHKFAHYPDTGNFKPTFKNLLKLAKSIG